MPRLGNLVGRFADDDDGARALDRDDADGTTDELWPDQAREPGRHIGLDAGPLPLRRPRRYEGELTNLVHEHDADMAEMLELKRQFLD